MKEKNEKAGQKIEKTKEIVAAKTELKEVKTKKVEQTEAKPKAVSAKKTEAKKATAKKSAKKVTTKKTTAKKAESVAKKEKIVVAEGGVGSNKTEKVVAVKKSASVVVKVANAEKPAKNGVTKNAEKKAVAKKSASVVEAERSRQIVERILLIEGEIRRRACDFLAQYNNGKVHEKQMLFHKCQKRNRWVFGGNRSGKTECGAVEVVWIARGIHPYRENKNGVSGWVVSVSYEVQRDVAQGKILKYLKKEWISEIVMQSGRKGAPEYGIIDYIVVKNVFGGESRIGFKSADQGREKFQGASLDFVWFDEEPPEDIYRECRMRLIDKKGEMFGTMTPLKGQTFVYDEIYLNSHDNPEAWYVQMEWLDNPYLDGGEVDALLKETSNDLQESRRFGRFRENSGLVYPEFEPERHVIEPFDVPREWYSAVSIDPGLHNPLSAHFYAVDGDGVIYVIAEHYESGKSIDHHAKKLFEIADRLDWPKDKYGRLFALCDSAAKQRTLSAQKSVSELFFQNGINVNCCVNKDIFSGIAKVKALFGANPNKVYVFKNCVNLIKELKSYRWGDNDSPKKCDDHALDEFRYFAMWLLPPRPKKRQKTEIEKDKEALIRKTQSAKTSAMLSGRKLG